MRAPLKTVLTSWAPSINTVIIIIIIIIIIIMWWSLIGVKKSLGHAQIGLL